MTLDLNTFLLAQALVSLISSSILGAAWIWVRETNAALYWCGAHLAIAVGVFLLATQPGAPSPALPAAFIFLTLSSGLIWGGVRALDGEPAWPIAVVAPSAIWFAVAAAGSGSNLAGIDGWVGWPLISLYSLLAVWELWRHRREGLPVRWALILLLTVRSGLFLILFVSFATGNIESMAPAFGTLPALVNVEHFVFTIGTTVFLLLMLQERALQRQKTAASHDSLSGLLNRGGFLHEAERLLAGTRAEDWPVVAILFDIDRFKVINDSYGHAIGDRVIEMFGTAAVSNLREDDIVGRIGGEEFAILLRNANDAVGLTCAERIRLAFREATERAAEVPVCVTVSAGIASCTESGTSIKELLKSADRALYRAKSEGRDRAVVARAREWSDHRIVPDLAIGG